MRGKVKTRSDILFFQVDGSELFYIPPGNFLTVNLKICEVYGIVFVVQLNVYFKILDFPPFILPWENELKLTFTLICELLGVYQTRKPCKCFKTK